MLSSLKFIILISCYFSSEPITGEGRWPVEPPFEAPPEEEVGASLGSALVTVAGSLAISFAVHLGCSVGYWALKRGWAWRKLNVCLLYTSPSPRD